MKIDGKVYCFFEQSGTFKNEFIKLDIPAEDYDIQNNFGQTDHVVDLFAEIENAYRGLQSIFDKITSDDLIIAFFPCIEFCDAKTMVFRGVSLFQKTWSLEKIMTENVKFAQIREQFYETLLKMVAVVSRKGLRMIIENPWNTSRATYLQNNFIEPTIIDTNRARRGDYFVKPTAYWFIGCTNTVGYSFQPNTEPKIVYKQQGAEQVTGMCDEQRSLISPDYARNFICDFILGKAQQHTLLTLF
jgi:hypothetical protein